jgi:hypothetical protein
VSFMYVSDGACVCHKEGKCALCMSVMVLVCVTRKESELCVCQ